MPPASKAFQAAHPITARPSRPACRPVRHARIMASVGQQPSLLTAEQTAKALELQQQRAQQRAAAAVPDQSASAAQAPSMDEADMASRQKAAREWITPWLDMARKREAQKVLAELRGRVQLLSAEQERAALQRLLGPDLAAATVAEAAPVHADDSSPNGGGNGSAAAAPAAEDHPSRCAPSEVLEDGALIYSMELLQALSYEDVLAP